MTHSWHTHDMAWSVAAHTHGYTVTAHLQYSHSKNLSYLVKRSVLVAHFVCLMTFTTAHCIVTVSTSKCYCSNVLLAIVFLITTEALALKIELFGWLAAY